jgi:16S rRNA (uracil1498-N3)-methyltransferase
VNLLLLRPGEVAGGEALVEGRRAAHVLGLLGKGQGDTVRVGVLGEGVCEASIAEADPKSVRVRLALGERSSLSLPTTALILALPRPKAVSRIVQLAASFGIRRLDLVGAHKVDPAYFSSPRLHPLRLSEDAWLGLEQGGLVHAPTLAVHRTLRASLQNPEGAKVVFDPTARTDLAGVLLPTSGTEEATVLPPVTLAFGPDGGFVPEELELLREAGFRAAKLAPSVLRTEVAVAAGLGQLELLRQLAFRACAPRGVLSPCPD